MEQGEEQVMTDNRRNERLSEKTVKEMFQKSGR